MAALGAGFLLVALVGLAAPPAGAQTPVTSMFRSVGLASGLSDPMQIEVAGDGRVFIAERTGALKVWTPATGAVTVAGTLSVSLTREDGLLGLVLDPGFAKNRRLFVLYSPKEAPDTLRLARFSLAADGRLDPATRRDVLRIPFRRNEHSSGGLAFDSQGHLLVGIGDDSNNLPDGFPPLDETAGRSDWDAQKSAANTDDLRGKILRIRPTEDGGYTVPPGNLFPPGGPARTRPEIYTMGNRNPFRLSVDPLNDRLYWAEPGPNAKAADPLRGPRGHDEVNLALSAGNYGWPYCVGPNLCYRDWNYATSTAGSAFDPQALRNDSPNNTGLAELPAARPAFLWYSYTNPDGFPAFGSGSANAAIAGPVYRFDPSLASAVKPPRDFDGHLFLLDWGRGYVHTVKLDAEGKPDGGAAAVQRFREGLKGPLDMEVGPDGALYLLCWGGGGTRSTEGTLVRLEYTGPQEPIAVRPARRVSGDGAGRRLHAPGAWVDAPAGAVSSEAYDLRGSRVWSRFLEKDVRRLRLPETLPGPVLLRFRP